MNRYRTKSLLKDLQIGIAIILLLSSCDPEFRYEISGKIIGQELNPIQLHYRFLPDSIANNWRSHITDSITQTNNKGELLIKQSTLTSNFEGIEISVLNPNYESITVKSNSNNWSNSLGLNLRESKYEMPTIQLVKIDSTLACENGINSASKEIQNEEYTFYEFLRTGTKNLKYYNRLNQELEILGIKYTTISLTDVEPHSNKEFERECYLKKMKEGLEIKFGKDWFEKLQNKIKE